MTMHWQKIIAVQFDVLGKMRFKRVEGGFGIFPVKKIVGLPYIYIGICANHKAIAQMVASTNIHTPERITCTRIKTFGSLPSSTKHQI